MLPLPLTTFIFSTIHSFIYSGYLYIAPSRNLLRGDISPATSKRNVLRSLQKEDTLFLDSKGSVRGSSFQVEGPITEKARGCLSEERARGTKSSPVTTSRRTKGSAGS